MTTKKATDLTIGEVLRKLKPRRRERKLRKLVKWPAILLVTFLAGMGVSDGRDDRQDAGFNAALKQLVPEGQPVPTVHTESHFWDAVTGALGGLLGWLWDLLSLLGDIPAPVWLVIGGAAGGITIVLVITWAMRKHPVTTSAEPTPELETEPPTPAP